MFELPTKYSDCTQFLEDEAIPTETVYHYTNWSGLSGILKKQQLWLTYVAHLNDTSEITYAIRATDELIRELPISSDTKKFFHAVLADLSSFISNAVDCYVTSFCAKQNHLYAWRAYSNDGAGYAIGFKPDFFIANSNKKELSEPSFMRTKVYYDLNYLKPHIEKLVKIAIQDLQSKLNPGIIGQYFAATLLPLLVSTKHNAYIDEHEYRICHLSPDIEHNQKFYSPGELIASPHLNPKKRIWFDFEIKNIHEIWIGPRLNYKHAEQEILMELSLLENQGHLVNHIHIRKSDIPYKNNYQLF